MKKLIAGGFILITIIILVTFSFIDPYHANINGQEGAFVSELVITPGADASLWNKFVYYMDYFRQHYIWITMLIVFVVVGIVLPLLAFFYNYFIKYYGRVRRYVKEGYTKEEAKWQAMVDMNKDEGQMAKEMRHRAGENYRRHKEQEEQIKNM